MLIQPSVLCIQSTSVSFMIKSKVTWRAQQSLRVFLTSQSRYEASRLWQFSVFSGVTVRPLVLLPRPPTDCSPPLNKYTSTTEKKRVRLKLTTDTIWYKSLHSATTAQSFILLKNNWKKRVWVTLPLNAPRPYVVSDLPPTSTVSSPMRYEESSKDSTLNGTASILSLSLFHWNRAPSREGMNILFPKIWRTERGHENLIVFDLIVVVNRSGTWFLSWEIFHVFDHQQQGGYNEQIMMDRNKGTDNTETLTNQLWVCVWHYHTVCH